MPDGIKYKILYVNDFRYWVISSSKIAECGLAQNYAAFLLLDRQ